MYTYTGTAFGARLAYHPNFSVKNLDVYTTLAPGYYLYRAKALDGVQNSPENYDTFYFGGNLGVRYFFTPKLGAWAELGYSSLSYISAGITIKF